MAADTAPDPDMAADVGAGEPGGNETTDAGADATDSTDVTDVTDVEEDVIPSTCTVVRALSLPSDSVSATLDGASENPTTRCTLFEGTGGPEHIYALNLTARSWVRLHATGAAPLVLAVRDACTLAAKHEVACAIPPDVLSPGCATCDGSTTLEKLLDAGDYLVLVEGLGAAPAGEYTLTVETSSPVANGSCADALSVGAGTVTGQTTAHSDYTLLACPPGWESTVGGTSIAGGAAWYRVAVPAHTRLKAKATNIHSNTSEIDVILAIVRSCQDQSGVSSVSEVSFANTDDAPREVLVAVGEADPYHHPATFDLTISFEDLQVETACASATPLTPGTPVVDDAATGVAMAPSCYPLDSMGGLPVKVKHYAVSIPPASRLHAWLESTGGLWLIYYESCVGPVCSARSDEADEFWLTNVGAEPKDIVLAAAIPDRESPGGLGLFTLKAEILPAAETASCETAPTLELPAAPTFDALAGGAPLAYVAPKDYDFLTWSPSHVAVKVPAGQVLHVSAYTPQPWGVASGAVDLLARGACDDPFAAFSSGVYAALVRTNQTTASLDVHVAVGARSKYFDGSIAFHADVRPPATNRDCEAAIPVTEGTYVAAEDSVEGTDKLSGRCLDDWEGPVLYYAATVPAGQRLTAEAVSTTKVAVRVLDGCAASGCLAEGVTKASFVNESGAPRDVVVAVGAKAVLQRAIYDLAVTIDTP